MAGAAIDVGARVSQYEVTSAPVPGAVGRGRLRLVWVRPPDVLVEPGARTDGSDSDTADTADVHAAAEAADAARGTVLAVLDAYRITRVPGRLAS